MNEKLRNQVAEMKKQTIGVEVEMNSITRSRVAKVAAEFFGTGRYEDTACRNGYRTWSAWDAQGRERKFQRDRLLGMPSDVYMRICIDGYKFFGFDTDLLQKALEISRKALL